MSLLLWKSATNLSKSSKEQSNLETIKVFKKEFYVPFLDRIVNELFPQYQLNISNHQIKFMLKYFILINLKMYYSETKVIMGGIAYVPILIFIVNLIKGKFSHSTKEEK